MTYLPGSGLKGILTAYLFCNFIISYSQENAKLIPFDQAYKRNYHAIRLQGKAPFIDGKLDERYNGKDPAGDL